VRADDRMGTAGSGDGVNAWLGSARVCTRRCARTGGCSDRRTTGRARGEALRACVDAILHKPARDADWRSTLRRFGLRHAQPTSHEGVSANERMGSS
jgi:hypothetical protein